MACINIFVFICLITAIQLLIGIFVFFSENEQNKCSMTYMFEYPQFVQIRVTPNHQRYGLYAYSEGRLTEKARNMHFDGIPVLFIPGNKGSHKQVRSFASVALRKALNSRPGFHFEFFTVDFNGEFSALNGALLYQQTDYVKQCIARILELYQKSSQHKPSSVILIGHSMGGVIAEGILSSLPSNSTLVPLVITLATYHVRPPVKIDWYVNEYYKKIEESVSSSENTALISIAGGINDILVPVYLTKPGRKYSLHTVSTSIPKVWLTTDHLSIVWCKELVLAITRALFESINVRTKQIIEDPKEKLTIFHHHLVHNSGIKIKHRDRYDLTVSMRAENDEWIEKLPRQYTVNLPRGTKHLQWYMIRLLDQPKHESLALIAQNLEVTDWVFVCPAIFVKGHSRVCEEGNHLSQFSEISPTVNRKRRTLMVNMHQLMKNFTKATHVVVKIPPTDDPVTLHVDVFSPAERVLNVTLPKWWSFPRYTIIKETPENAVYLDLLFPTLTHMVQSYLLYVDPIKCKNAAHHATASLIVPWAYQDVHTFITNNEKDPLLLRLHSSKPQGSINSTVFARLNLDPSCKYSVSVKASYIGMLGQMVRLYAPLLLANAAVVILLSLRSQLNCMARKGYCSFFFTAIKEGVKPYYILTTVKVVSKILSLKAVTEFLPIPDWQVLAEDGSDLFLLPLLLYMCSVGIVWMIASIAGISILVCETSVHKLALKVLAKNISGTIYFSDWLMSGLQKLPSVVAITLILIALNTCGGLSLCLGSVFYFLKLTQMSQEYIEEIVKGLLASVARKLKKKFSKNKVTLEKSTDEVKQTDSLAEVTEMDDNVPNISEDESRTQQTDDYSENEVEKDEETVIEEEEEEGEKILRPLIQEEIDDSETNATMEIDGEQADDVQSGFIDMLNIPSNNGLFFHFTMFLLWCMVTMLTFPSVLTWAHNFKYSTKLKPDPSFIPGVILSFCAIFLWQFDIPKPEKKGYKEVGYIIYILAALCLTYATLSLYRLVLALTFVFVLVIMHQLFAPKTSTIVEDKKSLDKEKIDKIKTKLD